MSGNKETKSDDEDDFRIKKKARIPEKHKNISRAKSEVTTRQRRTAIAQLNVVGGNSKNRKRHGSSTISSKAATSTCRYHPIVGSEKANYNDGKFPNLEFFHQSCKPQTTDKGSLGSIEDEQKNENIADEGQGATLYENKGSSSRNERMTGIKSGISRKKKHTLLCLETESSGSQTSDFELRLSDSSSEDEDFKSNKRVPKITTETHKRESFYVGKQAPRDGKSKLPGGDSSKACFLSYGNQRISKELESATSPLKAGESSAKHPEKDTENSRNTLESRKRKRTRSKKATCLMFTDVGNHTKADKSNLSETGISRKSDNCSFPRTGWDKPEMHTKLSVTSHGVKDCRKNPRNNAEDKNENEDMFAKKSRNNKEVKNDDKISRNSVNNREVQKQTKANVSGNSGKVKDEGKLQRNRILLDACIRLERISLKELKSKNNTSTVLEHFPQDGKDADSLAIEMKDNYSTKYFAVDDELDSLYQMAMLSPRSIEGDNESPPLPSSPSLNSDDQSLAISLFSAKDDNLDKEMNKDIEGKQLNSLMQYLSEEDKLSADIKFTNNQVTLDNDIATDTCLSLRTTNEDFPIKFVREEEVKSVTCATESADVELTGKNITSCVDALSPAISCDLGGIADEVGSDMYTQHELGICRDVITLTPGISAVCDSFNIDEECTGLDTHEILKHIESPRVLESEKSFGETNLDDANKVVKDTECPRVLESEKSFGESNLDDENKVVKDIDSPRVLESEKSFGETNLDDENKIVKDAESPCVLESEKSFGKTNLDDANKVVKDAESPCESERHNLPGETSSNSHHDSGGNNNIKAPTSLQEEDDLIVKFSDKLDTLDKDAPCHSMPQTTIQSHLDSENDDHCRIWRPAMEAPSPSYVLETRRLYGLPHERHHKAFCSEPKDIPSLARYD